MNSKDYTAGYDAAINRMDQGKPAQVAWNEAEGDMDCDFKRGWQKACEENGAKHPDEN